MKLTKWGVTVVLCDALIDQNRYIGEDSIGHGCTNLAENKIVINGNSYDICMKCMELIKTEPERVSFLFNY